MSCRFCEMIAAGEYEEKDGETVLFPPLCGTTARHMLAAPVQHVARADENPEMLGETMAAAARYARDREIRDFNLIQSNGTAATQGIFHLHVHIVPRVLGDGSGRTWPWTSAPTHLTTDRPCSCLERC